MHFFFFFSIHLTLSRVKRENCEKYCKNLWQRERALVLQVHIIPTSKNIPHFFFFLCSFCHSNFFFFIVFYLTVDIYMFISYMSFSFTSLFKRIIIFISLLRIAITFYNHPPSTNKFSSFFTPFVQPKKHKKKVIKNNNNFLHTKISKNVCIFFHHPSIQRNDNSYIQM